MRWFWKGLPFVSGFGYDGQGGWFSGVLACLLFWNKAHEVPSRSSFQYISNRVADVRP